VRAATVTVPDRERPGAALSARPHLVFPAGRYVLTIEWIGDEDEAGDFRSEAVALYAADVRALRDAMTVWLDQAVTR
jgi:hypothetical protein